MARTLGFLKKNKKKRKKQTRCSGCSKNPGTETLRKRPNIVRIICKSLELALWNDMLLRNICFLTVKLLKKQVENLFGTADLGLSFC